MKNLFNKAISAVLCVCIVFGLSSFAFASEATVEFGSYPQSRVTDEATVNALNQLNASFVSYNYYLGDASQTISSAKTGDYMKYADVELDGERYRGVVFTAYRPNLTYMPSDTDHSYQDDNGYAPNTVYWFKFEPIKWKILDVKSGLCVTEKLLDSQAFCEGFDYDGNMTYYSDSTRMHSANEYEYSKISSFLSGKFSSDAFTAQELDGINANGQSKVYLMNEARVKELLSSNEARKAVGTDYAKCQGLFVNNNASSWMLTDSYSDEYSGLKIKIFSQSGAEQQSDIFNTCLGVRPFAMIDSVIPEYTVTWYTENASESVVLREDANIVEPETPVKEGYTFNGWDNAVPEKMPANNLEFHATWKRNTYKVTWNMNGQQRVDSILFGDPIKAPAPAEKTGYLFDGWDKTIPANMPANDLVFNAQYEEIHATSIRISRQPTNKKYAYKATEIDLKGLTIEAECTDGKTVQISDTTQFKISGFDTSSVGQKKITVEYQGCQAQFNITVAYTWWQNIIRILLLGFLWY